MSLHEHREDDVDHNPTNVQIKTGPTTTAELGQIRHGRRGRPKMCPLLLSVPEARVVVGHDLYPEVISNDMMNLSEPPAWMS